MDDKLPPITGPSMTIRDFFAASALACLSGSKPTRTPLELAELAYEIADEMLRERAHSALGHPPLED